MHGDYGQVRRFVRKEHISVVSYEGLTPCAQPAIINASQNIICANIYHTSNNNLKNRLSCTALSTTKSLYKKEGASNSSTRILTRAVTSSKLYEVKNLLLVISQTTSLVQSKDRITPCFYTLTPPTEYVTVTL